MDNTDKDVMLWVRNNPEEAQKIVDQALVSKIGQTVIADQSEIVSRAIKKLDVLEELETLRPYIQKGLENRKQPILFDSPITEQQEILTIDNFLDCEWAELFDRFKNPENPVYTVIQEAKKESILDKNISDSVRLGGKPKYTVIPNTKLSNKLYNDTLEEYDDFIVGDIINAGEQTLPVLNTGTKTEVSIRVDIAIDNETHLFSNGGSFSEYDRAVSNSVYSIWEDRTKKNLIPFFTLEMLHNIVTGKSSGRTSQTSIQSMIKTLKKAQNTDITIDASEEFQKRNVSINNMPVTKWKETEKMLILKEIDTEIGGLHLHGYLIKSKPIMYKYAALTGQLITVKNDIFDIKETDENNKILQVSISNTESRIAAKSYLSRRIEIMRRDEDKSKDAYRKYYNRRAIALKKDPNAAPPEKSLQDFRSIKYRTILCDSIFKATESITNKQQVEMRKYIISVMKYWKARKYISNFSTRKKGKSFDAIEIEF